jgi:hypothetical protein
MSNCQLKLLLCLYFQAQLFVLSVGVLLVGFMAGYGIGVRDRETPASRHSKHFSSINNPMSASSHEHNNNNDLIFHELQQQISARNIHDNLK